MKYEQRKKQHKDNRQPSELEQEQITRDSQPLVEAELQTDSTNAPNDEEEDYIASPEEIAAEAKRQAERRNQRKNVSHKKELDEDNYPESGARPDDIIDPYAEPEPNIPWVKYEESDFLMRGCRHCPKCYEPVSRPERDSCSKLATTNWMSSIRLPGETPFNIVEVRFKNNRKDFYRLPDGLNVTEGDLVAVEGLPGHDIGIVSLTGEVCRLRLKERKIDPASESIKKLYRRAKALDIEKWVEAIKAEKNAVLKTRQIAESLGLAMKINDVEMQGDHSKAIFYYTADERVDFRVLIKLLAEEFHVRVEMKQIGVRQEAAKVGGIGTCGRELCCCTWLTNFRTVSTNAAKVQQILPNPQKLAGQCGKLKCCLNFEYDVYADALKKLPPLGVHMRFKKGLALYKKTDVFRGILWYAYEGEGDLHAIPADSVKKIIEMNRNQEYPEQLEDFQIELMSTSALEQETTDAEFEREIKRMAEGGNGVVDENGSQRTPSGGQEPGRTLRDKGRNSVNGQRIPEKASQNNRRDARDPRDMTANADRRHESRGDRKDIRRKEPGIRDRQQKKRGPNNEKKTFPSNE